MLRFCTTLLLLSAFAAQTFHKAVIVLDYYANTDSFALKCENKAVPQMHCNGKCQMIKKLKEEEKKETQNPERKTENKTQTLSSQSHFARLALHPPASLTAHAMEQRSARPIDRAYAIFHPPALV